MVEVKVIFTLDGVNSTIQSSKEIKWKIYIKNMQQKK